MHLLRTESRSLDDTAQAVDLEQTAAPLVFLSFTDSDLAALASAWEAEPGLPELRLAPLALLKHPYSVDLYCEKVIGPAKFVLVRLLGGKDYWRYGVEELAAQARAKGFSLAFIPGDYQADERLESASTLPKEQLRQLWAYFQEGGPENMAACLRFMAEGVAVAPRAVAPFDLFTPGCLSRTEGSKALIVFYRSVYLAADTAPILALAQALYARGFSVSSVYVTSLKNPAASAPFAAHIARFAPDVVLNTTAFSARAGAGGGVLDSADAPVFQVILAGCTLEQWQSGSRGLSAADQAMNVVLPEVDGRIVTRAISFKREEPRSASLQFSRNRHEVEASRVAVVADLAAAYARLRALPKHDRRLACILSDYPAKCGRTGYAVGLDTPKSVEVIAAHLREAGYLIGEVEAEALMGALTQEPPCAVMSLPDYKARFSEMAPEFRASVLTHWGAPEEDSALVDRQFAFRFVKSGQLTIAVQPDRGRRDARKSEYHDTNLPPSHGYVAFYLWLRGRIDALIHCGTHGTLEWLPGKAVALSEVCAPEQVLGAVPVIYPFIVNNPGEAAQAKRRLSAVTLGHLTPPLVRAGTHGAMAEIEALFDEYAQAETLDPRRASQLAEVIVQRAGETGLFQDSGIKNSGTTQDVLADLDAWLCDIKDMRIGDGLHVFGASQGAEVVAAHCAVLATRGAPQDIAAKIEACAGAEMSGLLAALDGRFVPPGPAGAPASGRLDVLPTGRNLFTIDPRAVPTRTAWEIGQKLAQEMLNAYAQEHGEWPKRVILDLWGSASMRTGGDELAQAFALIGVRPLWDNSSTRVSGFEILPLAKLGRARVDVTLRISGLFRDIFPSQIALFDDAVGSVAGLDEPPEDNPLMETRGPRVFGNAPGSYGLGLSAKLNSGDWGAREELGAAYLAANQYAYGAQNDGTKSAEFSARVQKADAFMHVQDLEGQDVLDSDAFAEHEGGFAAAAAALGAKPSLYHAETSGSAPKVRPLAQQVARVLRGRATNPRWIAGQMRHGHRGAAEMAETVDNLFAYAALAEVVSDEQFNLMFDATLGNEEVRAFLHCANPQAEAAMARKFDEALQRGLWANRRNSTLALLAEILGEAR